MQDLPIDSLEIDAAGSLLVRTPPDRSFEYIYREADGLRWDRQRHGFRAYEPARWEPVELLRHMAVTLRDCCDRELVFVGSTSWVGVSPDLRDALERTLTSR